MTSLTMTADKIGLTFVADWFKKLDAYFKAKTAESNTRFELNNLSDHELQDIGMTRGLIGQRARETYQMELEAQLNKHLRRN